jgi:hypothetical protein
MNNLKYTTSNEQGELPPGWRTRFSKSQPGKRIYSKCITQWKRPEVMTIAEASATSGNNKRVGGPQSINPIEVLDAPTQKTYTAERYNKSGVVRPNEPKARNGNNKQVGGPESINPIQVLEAPTQKTYTAERVEEVRNVPKMSKQVEMTGTTCGSLPPNAQEACRRSKGLKGGKGKKGTRRHKNRKGSKRTRRR